MKRLFPTFMMMIALLVGTLSAQQIIEKIEIIGNNRIPPDTIIYYLSSREGDYYNKALLKRDFKVLWSTGFFANLRIEEEDGLRGKVVKIYVEENPVIKNVIFRTGKKVKENDIISKLKEKDEYLAAHSYYNPSRVQKVKRTIKELLEEKGLQAARIDAELVRKTEGEVDLIFRIDEGPRLRVGEVVFVGRTKIPEGFMKEAMKDNRAHNLINWIGGKDVFKKNKLEDNVAEIKKRLQEFGYMEATVGEPRFEEITKRTFLFGKQKMMRIIIPVDPGYVYRTGEIKIEGNKFLMTKYLQSLVELKPGEIYSSKKREKTIESMGESYRNFGFLYSQIIPVENLDPKQKVVNVTFNIQEGEVTFLRKLEFKGNTFTKDKVLRREFLLREGDRFSLALFKDSLLRLRQLGLVDVDQEPDIKPDPENPSQIDVNLNVRELQRNNIQFTAGYSGYEGTFVAFSFSTVNFLGTGESLDLTLQHGKRVKNYSFGMTKPYIFDRPMTLGFNVFDRKVNIPYLYNQYSKGVYLTFGARVRGYTRFNLTYSFQDTEMEVPTYETEEGESYYYNPYFYPGKYYVSALEPIIYRSTIDSPLTPSRGTMYSVSLKYAGNFLGGDVHLYRPRFEFARYQPIISNHVLGVHIEYMFVKPIKGDEVPYWERFFLGGEQSIRGYDFYTIGPRDERNILIGGEKSLVGNFEYIIPFGGPLYGILFYDFGNALLPSEKFSLKNMYSSAGLEIRVFVPALRVPFRLIFAYNNKKIYADDSNFAFRFAIGTTF
ncbi:MAG: outer membrane protein assembly factor BamA [Acidobacteriota bacterium]|nr:outer membrane protein assembly factor BamA [Acidobacteriota bacterium]MDW3229127.1 outer membrane protein assembly factor BamA [Acidobacteriota bacterium]MDY0230920.1 outer membrane protein assembly factor BamA [Candidatus Saccharicenans sp.]